MPPVLTLPFKKIYPYALLALVVAFAYANALGNGFVYDDDFLILNNRFLSSWHFVGDIFSSSTTAGSGGADSFYRPLQIFVYFLLRHLFGLQPFAFHALNILLHMANACLLFRLGIKLGFNWYAALAATALWALHPVHVEAVTYVNSLSDQLYAFFSLLGCIKLLPDFSQARMGWALLCFLLALLSKESAIAFPALVCSLAFLTAHQPLKTYVRSWPLWLLAAAFALFHFYILHLQGDDFGNQKILLTDFSVRFFTFLGTLPDYVSMLLWPSHLHMERNVILYTQPMATPVLLGAAILLAVLVVIVRGGQGLKPLRWGLIWFCCAHALHTGLLLPINAPLGEHWLYLPSAGLFIGVGQQLFQSLGDFRAQKYSPLIGAFVLFLALIWGMLTCFQNEKWKEEKTFYSYLIDEGTHSERVYNNLGYYYYAQGDAERAIALLEKAIALNPDYTRARVNMAAAFMLRLGEGDAELAQKQMEMVLQKKPDDAECLTNAARILLVRGGPDNKQRALTYLEHAVKSEPDYREAYPLLIDLEKQTGNLSKAQAYARQYNALPAAH